MDEGRAPPSMADAAKKTVRITLPGGARVGIAGLEQAMQDVRTLGLESEEEIKIVLLRRVKASNDVPENSEQDYMEALIREYRNFLKE